MIDAFLVPENTVVTAKGDGPGVDIGSSVRRVFLLNLRITDIIEQESLDVSIHGSTDCTTYDPKPLAAFPQKFYRGETSLLLDLSTKPEVIALRAHWDVNRWGRGTETPMFKFGVTLREVPDELIAASRERRATS
jgi:hypothetical protein